MGAWIDDPDWGSALGRRLRRRLGEEIKTPDEIEPIIEAVGIRVADHPFGGTTTAAAIWISVTSQEVRKLRPLLNYLREAVPSLQPDIAEVLAASRASGGPSWYHADPPETARLFGPGNKRCLIARSGLGAQLLQITGTYGLPVLQISGDKGMGKTHTRYFLAHILDATRSSWIPAGIDVAREWPPEDYVGGKKVSVREFVGRLSAAVGLDPRYDGVVDQDDQRRLARELATAFTGRYNASQAPPRILILDGLDRLHLDVELIGIFVSHLAGKVVLGDLPRVRLVVTGYSGSFDPDVVDVLANDWAGPIQPTEVAEFFRSVGLQIDQALDPETVQDLVDQTLAKASLADHAALGRAASLVAHDHFGQQP